MRESSFLVVNNTYEVRKCSFYCIPQTLHNMMKNVKVQWLLGRILGRNKNDKGTIKKMYARKETSDFTNHLFIVYKCVVLVNINRLLGRPAGCSKS